MDTRFLESFLVIVACGSLAEAARRLNLTPAALAQRIQSLESEVGVKLTARSGQRVKPTAAGLALASRAQVLLRELHDLTSAARLDHFSKRLRIGVALTAISGLLCRVLPTLAQKYPEVEISVVKGYSGEVYRKLTNADVDAAFIFRNDFDIPKTYEWVPLRDEPYIVLAKEHLAAADPLHLLRTEPFVRYDRSLWSGQLADKYLRRMRIRPRERLELDSLEAIAVLVDQGLGISLVPDWLPPWPENLSLAKLQLPEPRPERHLGLIWPQTSSRHPLLQELLDVATHVVRAPARARA